jgi:hypothetical protein
MVLCVHAARLGLDIHACHIESGEVIAVACTARLAEQVQHAGLPVRRVDVDRLRVPWQVAAVGWRHVPAERADRVAVERAGVKLDHAAERGAHRLKDVSGRHLDLLRVALVAIAQVVREVMARVHDAIPQAVPSCGLYPYEPDCSRSPAAATGVRLAGPVPAASLMGPVYS